MDLQWEERFRHVLNHMSAFGRLIGTDVLVLGDATLFMSETSYCFTAAYGNADGMFQVTAYFWRGVRQVEFLRGTEEQFLEFCRNDRYDLPDQLV
jgi:hypothetical protein